MGRAVVIQGRPFTIVGVTPPEFFGTQPGRHVDVTTPLAAQLNITSGNAVVDVRALHETLFARFAALPGVQSVTTAMDTPPAGEMSMCAGVFVPGDSRANDDGRDAPVVCHNFVGSRFFATLIASLDDRVASALAEERLLAALANTLGALASILAAIGIYSMVAAAIARRQHEIGIRLALGAMPAQIARMIAGDTFMMIAAGLAIGIPAAIAAAQSARAVLSDILFDVSPVDPLSMIGSAIAILLIASLAASVPLRRAARLARGGGPFAR